MIGMAATGGLTFFLLANKIVAFRHENGGSGLFLICSFSNFKDAGQLHFCAKAV
jgi:hypothetical protein